MKRSAAAITVLLCVAAGGLLAEPRRGQQAASRRTADVIAHDAVPFENAGVISGTELAFFLEYIGDAGARGRSSDPRALAMRLKALRGLGRLERRDLVAALAQFTSNPALRETAHLAVTLALRPHASAENPDEEIVRTVSKLVTTAPVPLLGQLPYATLEQFETAETRLAAVLGDSRGPRASAARALEALARRNRRLTRLSDETLELLRKGARRELPYMNVPDDEALARESFAALMAAGVVDGPAIEAALGETSPLYRRLGAFALFGTGATLTADERTRLVRVALADRDYTVRYDGLRAWIRRETSTHGCAPVSEALSDESLHVVLAAIDALGDRCVTGEEAEPLTLRLLSDLRTPPAVGSWHREAHALVAAARRVPDRAAAALAAFRTHSVWQVRMYAARAADVLKDAFTLEKLAYDDNDNVREAALMPLQRVAGADSEPAFIAALGRPDYQLVRTAALGLKGRASDRHVLAALSSALQRITAEKKETSRDTRLALLERLREAGPSQAGVFEQLLTDFDPRIAAEATQALRGLTGVERTARPATLRPETSPTQKEMDERQVARVELDTGRFFEIRFDKTVAPLAYSRIARLVRAKYYDRLTFHRVVANFVIQGGSPGANEYAGAPRFMRDELSERPHARGTVGLSTRGHHTADAQIFVNLADNRTLDFDYTVIGEVRPAHMPIVDTIQEGTRIMRIQMVPEGR